jgi:hypothetical protein
MAYVDPNFKTKKDLKEAVARGDTVIVFSPGPFPVKTGREFIEGPHYPQPHKWYAEVTIDENKRVLSVK